MVEGPPRSSVRLDALEWLAHIARDPKRISAFVLDLATAYLLSFEIAIQVLDEEKRFPSGVDKWLATLPAYDFTFRGIRTLATLRHTSGLASSNDESEAMRFTGGEGGSNIGWRGAVISVQEFHAVRSPRIAEAELPVWNQVLEEQLVMDLMRDGMNRLVAVFAEAE